MASALQLNFTRGALSPLLRSRIDLDHYKAGMETMQNWTVLRYGGMTRTPGSLFRGFAKTDNRTARFIPFVFNRAQAYMIEAGHLYFRFWNRDTKARVESPPGTPVEIVTPYTEADLKRIQTRQSGDLVFIFCEGYWPRVLTRSSETSWAIALYVPQDGPYLDINTTATTLDPGATSGSMLMIASSTTGINGGAGFQAGDVGRVIRFLEAGGRWYWFVITVFTSTTQVSVVFMGRDDGNTGAMPGHAASANWQLGAWSAYEGYPQAVGAFEGRLVSAATDRQPNTVWYTVPQDTGLDDYSFQSPLAADDGGSATFNAQLSAVQWIADGQDIILGTEGALRVLGREDEGAGFGPTNQRTKIETAVTTSYIPGFFIERYLVFLDFYRVQFYEAAYADSVQGYVASEVSALNEHLFKYGVTSIAYQHAPGRVLWMTTDEGPMLGVTYDRTQEVFGAAENEVGNSGIVEWVTSLPGIDADGDQVWLIVQRTIDGVVRRTIEILGAFWREGTSIQEYPIYTYCAQIYDGVATTTVSSLTDFEGATFGIWADGVDLGDATVQDGDLVLPNGIEAEVIIYGYRQSSLARTLRLGTFDTEGQPAIGKPSLGSEVTIDVFQTGFLRVGMGQKTTADYNNGLDPVRPDDSSEHDPFDPAVLRTDTFAMKVDDSWSNNGVCTIETDSVHPATVLSLNAEVEGSD